MPINLELNSTLGNQTYFYQKCESCTQKSNETWNLKIQVKIYKNSKHLRLKGSRLKLVGPKSLYIQDLRIHGSSIGQIKFSFWSFTFDLDQICTKKCSKSAKSNPIFHLKGRRDTSWLYNFWIAQWVNFFLQNYFFKNLAIFFRGKKGVKVGPKVQTLGISRFCKNLSFSKILKALFLFPWILPVVKILAESGNIWGS